MSPSDNRSLKICSLNARSLRNKSSAFVELVNDLKVDLFTVCETWLSVNDSAVLNELTPTGVQHSISLSTIWQKGWGNCTACEEWICH